MAAGPDRKIRARYVAFARAVALAIAVAIVEALIQVFSGQDLPDRLQIWGPVIVAALRVVEGEIDDYRERSAK